MSEPQGVGDSILGFRAAIRRVREHVLVVPNLVGGVQAGPGAKLGVLCSRQGRRQKAEQWDTYPSSSLLSRFEENTPFGGGKALPESAFSLFCR